MPKVTHIFKTYFPETSGGLEEAIRQYGTVAVENGFDVDVVAVGRNERTVTENGIRAEFYKKNIEAFSTPFSWSLVRSFKSIVARSDILHFHFPWPTAELLALVHTINKPSLVTFHCDIHKARPLKTLYLPFVNRFLRKMDKICVTNKGVAETTPCLKPFRHKTESIPLFVNEKRFKRLAPPDPQWVEFARTRGAYALFAGMLRWYKGLDVLLDAAKELDHDVVVVGKGFLEERLKSRIRNEGIANVHLTGFLKDENLRLLIEHSRMVVLPSITSAEAFGQILLEGLYFSKPLVSTELGTGTSLVNCNNYTGFVVRPGCSRSLADAMERIFTDQALFERFSANAFFHFQKNFTADMQGKKYLDIYRSFL